MYIISITHNQCISNEHLVKPINRHISPNQYTHRESFPPSPSLQPLSQYGTKPSPSNPHKPNDILIPRTSSGILSAFLPSNHSTFYTDICIPKTSTESLNPLHARECAGRGIPCANLLESTETFRSSGMSCHVMLGRKGTR